MDLNNRNHYIVQCMRPVCQFRFPVGPTDPEQPHCPKCGAPTQRVDLPYAALRVPPENKTNTRTVSVLVDNLRSAFNVGSIFRTADGAGVSHVYLCGITPTPDHPKVGKTALGAESTVPWTQVWNAAALVKDLKQQGTTVWALEGGAAAHSIYHSLDQFMEQNILLVVGNEISGVDPGILELCDQSVFLPMLGQKESLNVAVAFGIAIYTIQFSRM